MKTEVSADFGSRLVITKISDEFKKGAKFDPNAEYLVMQNNEVLGVTNPLGNHLFTSKNTLLDEKSFPGIKFSGLLTKKANLDIWCFKKEFNTYFRSLETYHGIKSNLYVCIKFKLVDSNKAKALATNVSKYTNITLSDFDNLIKPIATDTVEAICKIVSNKGGKYFPAKYPSAFDDVIKRYFKNSGYELVIEDMNANLDSVLDSIFKK